MWEKWMKPFLSERGHLLGMALSCLLLLNVLAQKFEPKAMTEFGEWDHHQIFYCFEESRFGKELGTETFTMYGPAVSHTLPFFTPNSHHWLVGMWGVLFFYLLSYVKWCRQLEGKAWPWIFVSVFALFNVPSLSFSPFILIVWSLSRKKEEGEYSLFTLSGWLYVAWLFLFKSSWGIIGFLHLLLDGWVRSPNLRRGFSTTLSRSCGVLGISFLFYLLVTERGDLDTFIEYCFYALEDTRAYPSYNGSPVALHFISSAWTGWQEWVHQTVFGEKFAKGLLSSFPIGSFFICLWVIWKSRRYKELLLVLPVLFGEYKHSYVRADVTNLYGIFYLIPCALFVMLCSKWSTMAIRRSLGGVLILWVVLVVLGFFPYNTPYRHPRDVWLGHLWVTSIQGDELREESAEALEKHLLEYEPMGEHMENKRVLSLPARNDLALLGSPVILASNQPYFAMEGMKRSRRDLEMFTSEPPEIVILEDRVEFFRPGGLHEFPSLLKNVLLNYDAIKTWNDFTVLKHREGTRGMTSRVLHGGNFKIDSGSFPMQIPNHSFVVVRLNEKERLREKMVTALLKSPRFSLALKQNGVVQREIHAGSMELRQGVAMYQSVEGLFDLKAQDGVELEIRESYTSFPHEVSDDLHGTWSELDLEIELWSFL